MTDKNTVYLSFAGDADNTSDDNQEESIILANEIEKRLVDQKIKVIRYDKKEERYSIPQLIKEIGSARCVVSIISKKYLTESSYCQQEIYEMVNQRKLGNNISPILTKNAPDLFEQGTNSSLIIDAQECIVKHAEQARTEDAKDDIISWKPTIREYIEKLKEDSGWMRSYDEVEQLIEELMVSCGSSDNKPKDHSFRFTHVEEVLPNNGDKHQLITLEDGNGDGAELELWEVGFPSKNYFLIFHNEQIQANVKKFVRLIRQHKIDIPELTILKPNTGVSRTKKEFIKLGFKKTIFVLSYGEYVWNSFIKRNLMKPKKYDGFYIETDFCTLTNSLDNQPSKDSAATFFYSSMKKTNTCTANIVVARGGIGKTRLCRELFDQFVKTDGNMIPVLLDASSFKNKKITGKIQSIYDLYEIYTRNNPNQKTLEREIFDAGVFCGNIVVFIDGLDEFVDLFQSKFDMKSFVESLNDLNNQMGKSKVFITSRENVIDDYIDEIIDLPQYKLLGFSLNNLEAYLAKRFFSSKSHQSYIKEIIVKSKVYDKGHERFIPYFVDLLSEIFEAHLKDQGSEKNFTFSFSLANKDYESNEEFTDQVVFSVLNREIERQSLDVLSTADMVRVLREMSIENGPDISEEKLKTIISMYHQERVDDLDSIVVKIQRNPLLLVIDKRIKFRYDIFLPYFQSLYVIHNLLDVDIDDAFLQFVSIKLMPLIKHPDEEHESNSKTSNESSYVVKYFSKNKDLLLDALKLVIPKISSKITSKEKAHKKSIATNAISSLLFLYTYVNKSKGKVALTNDIKSIFEVKSDNRISHLFIIEYENIKLPFPALNFDDLDIWDSKFINYKGFLKSSFNVNTVFHNSYFKNIPNPQSKNLNYNMFDNCNENGIRSFVKYKEGESKDLLFRKQELRHFFESFYDTGHFMFIGESDINFSEHLKALSSIYFNDLIKAGIIRVDQGTGTLHKYSISKKYHKEAISFLDNNSTNSTLIIKILQIIDKMQK